jgi:hypothetical protein
MWTARTTRGAASPSRLGAHRHMTSNQRRPGFRLPWAVEADSTEAAGPDEPAQPDATTSTSPSAAVPAEPRAVAEVAEGAAEMEAPSMEAGSAPPRAEGVVEAAAEPTQTRAAGAEPAAGFMRDLVAAMRRVAEETRQSSLSDLRTKAEEQVRTLEADSEQRREELKTRADADIAGVGEWAKAETERIAREAEQREVARRAQLDQQLAAEATRAESDAKALRDRVAEYERELDAYHAQLSDIADPAAFAAAAKRMPSAPHLRAPTAPPIERSGATPPSTQPAAAAATQPAAVTQPASDGETGSAPAAPAGSTATPPEIHPGEEEVLAARLAELDAELGPAAPGSPQASSTEPASTEAPSTSTATEVVVKGLGSFGAITGFRQALASVEGVDGVSLSLGPTGEFVFRAIHAPGFNVAAAIGTLEGDAAKIEPQPNGTLKVTLEHAR